MRTSTFALSAIILTGSLLAGVGCESTQTVTRLDQAKIDYDARRFQAAYDNAVEASDAAKGTDRQDAAYLAGLSAYKLGNMSEAETHFVTAINSPNRRTAGNAKAMLGLIRLNQGRNLEAARLFKEAAAILDGADARQAAQHAALAFEAAGDYAAASTWTDIATEASGDTDATTIAVGNDAASQFALQVGAFRDRWRAEKAADDAKTLAENRSLGPVRLISQRDDRGRQMFLVQVGSFATRQQAATIRAEIGRLEYIVTAAEYQQVANADLPSGY